MLQGIKMLIGSFPLLFGQPLGRRLQDWCTQRGWVLLWALGNWIVPDAAGRDSTNAYLMGNRSIDPAVFGHTSASHNLSLSSTVPAFEALWAQAEKALLINATTPPGTGLTVMNASVASALWGQLPKALGVELLGGRSCSDNHACVGVQRSGGRRCVCYSHGSATVAATGAHAVAE